jgi:putative sigma-54 modulation protein
MNVEYTGRQMEVGPELRAACERRLRKLARVLPSITHVHVVLGVDNHRESAEVTVQSPHLSLAAAEEGHDVGQLLVTVVDRLTRQAERHVGKWRERKRRAPARARALWSGVLAEPTPAEAGGPRVVRTRRFLVKPMTVEEAILEMGAGDDGVVVFRDAASERVKVLYRRKDGNLGLIEPEA